MIFSYDSTSMMESMAMNIPTVCFWNKELWSWRESAQLMLDMMEETGIFHSSPGAVSSFISRHIEEGTLETWWQSAQVQKVRNEYCRLYAHTSGDEYRQWKTQLDKWM